MTITRRNSFESGLTPGTPITNNTGGNTGGPAGDYLNAVFASAGNSIQYSDVRMHGSLAAKMDSGGGGSASLGYDWKEAEGTAKLTTAMRGYFRWASLHTGNTVIMQTRGAEAGSTGFFVRYNTENKLQVVASAGSLVLGTVTAALALNTWYRIEFYASQSGDWALRVYNGDTYVMAVPEISGSGANSGMAAGFTFWRWAQDGTTVNALSYVDDIAYADDWVGPVEQTEARPVSVSGAGWLANGAAGMVVGMADNSDLTYSESPSLASTYQPISVRLATLGPGDIQIKVRLSGDQLPTVRVRLLQGSTVISTWSVSNVPTAATDYAFNVAVADLAKITDRAALVVEIGGIL